MADHLPVGPAARCPRCVARHGAYRTEAPRIGFWQRPVGALASVLLVVAYALALFGMLVVVGGGR